MKTSSTPEITSRLILRKIGSILILLLWLVPSPSKTEIKNLLIAIGDSTVLEQKHVPIEETQARFENFENEKLIKQQEVIVASEKQANTQTALLFTFIFLAGIGGYYIFGKKLKNKINTPLISLAAVTPSNGINIEKINTKLLSKLTNRESEVIVLLEKGLTNHQIADRLFVSENTIKTHLKNIYSKTTAQNRTELLHKLRNY